MMTRFAKFIKSLAVLVLLVIVKTECMPVVGALGNPSRCANYNCLPQPSQNCWPSFDQDDGCCPVWHCTGPNGNNFVSYGKGGKNGGGSSVSFTNNGGVGISSSSFSSSSSFGAQPLPAALPSFNFGVGGFPFGGRPPFSGFPFSLGFTPFFG